jgi:la-related protein 1
MPVFSYAQAAKGQTPLHISSASSSVSNSNSAEPAPRSASTHRPGASEESDGSEMTRRASEAQLTKASVEGSDLSSSVVAAPAADASKEMSSSNSQSGSEPPHQQLQSAPPSPAFGSTSTSTVLKEDDASATPNGSSESTWDKISQTSQNVEKLDGKADGDDEDMKLSTWEHVPAPATLKEAPPPAFNIWEKRKMDQQAKVTKDSKSSQSPKTANNKDSPQDGKKTQDDLPDLGRLDGKKRARPGQVSDDKSTSPTAREGGKVGDGRYKTQDDGKIPLY